MKKSFIVIVVLLAILVLTLSACSNTLNSKTIGSTQAIWDETECKEAHDTITISNFRISNIFIVKRLVLSTVRKFEQDKVTIDFIINQLNVEIKSVGPTIINSIFKQLESELDGFTYDDFMSILNNFKEITGKLILSDNNSKLDYNVSIIIDNTSGKYNKNLIGNLSIDSNAGYDSAISQSLDLLLSHLSAVFAPENNGTATFNPTIINNILKAAITYKEATDPNKNQPDYKPISSQLNKILGLSSYTQLLTKKIKINETKSECVVKKNFIQSMNIEYLKTQLLYNKEQFIRLLEEAVKILDPASVDQIKSLKLVLVELTPGESCVEIDKITVESTYKLN